MTEILLGFDVREMWLKTADLLHPAHQPSTFLLRDGIGKVFSADVMVWPSLLEDPFQDQLAHLEDAIPRGSEVDGRPYTVIAATWHGDDPSEPRPAGSRFWAPVDPPQRDPGWLLLGFDVTDGSFLSGLSNCGYDPQQRAELVSRWGPSLNEHHLFRNMADALEFRLLSNDRVPEHAPFSVIGLWLIRDGWAAK